MGLTKTCSFDTSAQPGDEAKELERLVADCRLSGETRVRSEKGRDLQEYEVTVVEGGKTHVLDCDDGTIPAVAKPLIQFLKKHARPVPPGGT